jgi:hypothetical protein
MARNLLTLVVRRSTHKLTLMGRRLISVIAVRDGTTEPQADELPHPGDYPSLREHFCSESIKLATHSTIHPPRSSQLLYFEYD